MEGNNGHKFYPSEAVLLIYTSQRVTYIRIPMLLSNLLRDSKDTSQV